jgi:hypothetical protein
MFVCLSVCLEMFFFLWKMFILGRILSIHLSMHALILHSVIFFHYDNFYKNAPIVILICLFVLECFFILKCLFIALL